MSRIFDWAGIEALVGFGIVVLFTFFSAWPTKSILITTNTVGEAWIEAVLLPLSFLWGLTSLVRLLR